jgi:5-methyltetrahydropteroyltriglutamate--homocysteine methyltransferase
MALKTTCIGAFPKPDYVPITDWFQVGHDAEDYTNRVHRVWEQNQTPEATELMDRATAEVVADQLECGIDVPTDGEIRRENYVHYQCRHFDGFDFEGLTERTLRNGAYVSELPTIRSKVSYSGTPVLVRDWQIAERAAGVPVKMTLPGPMTISDTTADAFYTDPEERVEDLAAALNQEILALAEAGCRHIQIDEPIFARKPDEALAYGVRTLARCFEDMPASVTRVMHMCCGYPNRLDDEDYPKADQDSYIKIAQEVDGIVDQISIEDAHRHNPSELFELFETSTLIVGFVRVASSRRETVDEIRRRMDAVLQVLPEDRLMAAPDCGLGFLGRDLAKSKLRHLSEAASAF